MGAFVFNGRWYRNSWESGYNWLPSAPHAMMWNGVRFVDTWNNFYGGHAMAVSEVKMPKTRTITFHEWVVWSTEGLEEVDWWVNEPTGWAHRFKTGRTREVEVPV